MLVCISVSTMHMCSLFPYCPRSPWCSIGNDFVVAPARRGAESWRCWHSDGQKVKCFENLSSISGALVVARRRTRRGRTPVDRAGDVPTPAPTNSRSNHIGTCRRSRSPTQCLSDVPSWTVLMRKQIDHWKEERVTDDGANLVVEGGSPLVTDHTPRAA
jgi:hypothetical protein